MRTQNVLTLALFATGAWSQTVIEPAKFNITQALLNYGVVVSKIPALANVVELSLPSACSVACNSLNAIFGTKVIFQQSPEYAAFKAAYWSQQQSLVNPYCVFKPTEAENVAVLVLISRLTQCPFAVKSGGHARWTGSSSIEGGITVSLEKMSAVTVSPNRKMASIGPGNRWLDVYAKLERENLAVIGGRVADVGVSGLILGGGISFFSNRYGWACDNVASFEVVTASGLIIKASEKDHPELYWALRGGGNNFGIVTQFNLEAIPVGSMWGGGKTYLGDKLPALHKAFYNFGTNVVKDPDAHMFLAVTIAEGTKLTRVEMDYAKPVAHAPIFNEFLAIPDAIDDGTGIKSLANLTLALNASNPSGLRQTFWTTTFKLDEAMVAFTTDVCLEVFASIEAVVYNGACSYQLISMPQLKKMAQKGGNPLGLSSDLGPIVILLPGIMWNDSSADDQVQEAARRIIERTNTEAKRRGLYVDYIYMNYASEYQLKGVIPAYGRGNQQRLKRIAAKYDPAGVFQKLQPGYFKLE